VASDPAFSPDGSKVMFVVADANWNTDIASVNVDGSDFTIVVPNISLVGGPPALSPDGTKLAYSAPVANGDLAIMVANADGSNPVQITDPTNTPLIAPIMPTFSPDGSKIAVINEDPSSGNDLWVMQASDGSNPTRLTSDGDVTDPQWSTDGAELLVERYNYDGNYDAAVFSVAPTTGATQMVAGPPAGFAEAGSEATSPPGSPGYISDDQYLALTFEPLLLFDTTESWPPLSVDAFFAEGSNHICTAGQSVADCAPITSESSLSGYNAADDFIAGDGNGSDPSTYQDQTINSDCESSAVLGLLDCNSGPRSLIYYHVTPYSQTGYYYIDYWMFYRFNFYPWFQYYSSAGDHEGDWESVTIGLSTTDAANTFDFASFSQHGPWYSYLRQNLTCDTTTSSPGSCVGAPNAGNRVADFVAGGTHANYPDECSGGSTLLDACWEENSDYPEGSHNGALIWGNNFFDDASLSLFPAPAGWSSGSGAWTDWPGLWGNPNVFTSGETPPRGPDGGGSNAAHYGSPWVSGCSSGNDNCPLGAGDNAAPARGNLGLTAEAASALPHGRALRDASNPAACGNWFGSGVSVVVCDPTRLKAAVDAGQLHRRGSFSGSTTARDAHRASAPGLVQILSSPLRVGDTATIVGPSSRSTVLFVRGADGRGMAWEARFANVRLRRSAHATLRVRRVRGKLVVELVINNQVRRPNELLKTRLRLQGSVVAPPKHRHG
jgi:hypothetical protein